MPSGETLLRNFVLGQRYFEDTFGIIPGIASLEDAFGQSAQIPQILRGVECKMAIMLSRKKVPGGYFGLTLVTLAPAERRTYRLEVAVTEG